MRLKITTILCLYFSFISCLYSQENNFLKGHIFQEKITTDTSLSYQVYFPNSLANEPAPILFIFDPSARSIRAMELFIHAAEKCRTILICSDQSKNGPFDKNLSLFEKMYADVTSKFEFNPNIQILTGFSGGARLSTYLAVRKQKFCGVIACGAGLPVDERYWPSVISGFGYYGIVGRKDMNYTEMLEVEKFMAGIKMDHYFSYTEDAHQWPSPENLSKALTWQLARMEQKNKNSAKLYTTDFLNAEQQLLDEKKEQKNTLQYQNIKSALTATFHDIGQYLEFKAIDSASLIRQLEEQAILIEKEQKKIGVYFRRLNFSVSRHPNSKPISWWKSEYEKWEAIEMNSTDEKKYQAIRMKNFISGYAHQSVIKYIESEEFEKAEWLTILISEISEQKAYAYFLQAKLAALKKEYKVAEKKLKMAVENGLSQKAYLLDEPAFDAMYERKGFQKILSMLE